MSSNNLLNPAIAGLMHLIQLTRDEITNVQRRLEEVNKKIAAVVADYIRLAHIHNFRELQVPGYQTFTRQHEGQSEKATFFLVAMFCTALLAIVLGTYFSTNSLVAQSPVMLFLGCALVAAVLEPICAAILRAVLGVDPEDRRSIKRAFMAIGVFGVAFLSSLLEFAYIRFNSTQANDVILAIVIAAVEIFAILLAASFDCAYRYFNWSRRLDKKFHKLDEERSELEERLADLNIKVQESEFQLNQMQPPATIQTVPTPTPQPSATAQATQPTQAQTSP